MRIILGIFAFLFISFWLAFIIEVGVSAGMRAFFYKSNFQNKKEEKENESI